MVTTGALAVGVVVAAAAVTAALLVLEGPTVSRGSVVATLPWMVTAGLLHALGAYGAYPGWLLPVVRLPVGVLLYRSLREKKGVRARPQFTRQEMRRRRGEE